MSSFVICTALYIVLIQMLCSTGQDIAQQAGIQQCSGLHCNRFCHIPEGRCLPSGQCLCQPGFTGPNARNSTRYPGQVEADHCLKTCHPVLRDIPCDMHCDVRCGGYHKCLPDGKCLCWWGWTGPNAYYAKTGQYENRIIADFCDRQCNYGMHHSSPWCAQIDQIIFEYL